MSGPVDLVRHSALQLRPDPSRVIARPFLPGQEILYHGISRAEAVLDRVLALSDDDIRVTLAHTVESFSARHPDLLATFRAHFALVAHRVSKVSAPTGISTDRADLVGAYFTQEYAIEGAAIFNPSIVPDPSQSEAGPGQVRFILTLRAVGEGHLSTIEFRRGTLGPGDVVTVDEPLTALGIGTAAPLAMTLDGLRRALRTQGDAPDAESILSRLPARFTAADLEEALASNEMDTASRVGDDGLIQRIRRLVASNYEVTFPDDLGLSARVLYPSSPAESAGMEDARFTRFDNDDGSVTHYATYTAFDGSTIAPHLIETEDFRSFAVRQLSGTAASNKGMAMFPRRIGGRFWALSRWDRENLSVTHSADALHWEEPLVVQRPAHAWDLIQLGPCASPIETADGWLVITHGVGPVRTYSIGALLLDLDDPTIVLGVLDRPLMTFQPADRNGYVPNVVYTCGALLHGSTLLLPYGCADATIRFAFVDVPGVLSALRDHPSHLVRT